VGQAGAPAVCTATSSSTHSPVICLVAALSRFQVARLTRHGAALSRTDGADLRLAESNGGGFGATKSWLSIVFGAALVVDFLRHGWDAEEPLIDVRTFIHTRAGLEWAWR
jgi:hypothetical protein